MRIVQINAVYGAGSTGRMAQEMHNYFLSIGHDSYVFSGDIMATSDYVKRIGNTFDHKLHAFFSRLFGLQGYFSTFPTLRLLWKLQVLKPDIVHLHNLHNNYINLPLLLRFLAKKNIHTVLTLHDCWFYTGHCCHYTIDNCNKWKTGCGNCPALSKGPKSWFFDTSSKVYNDKKCWFDNISHLSVIGNSEWMAAQARESFLKNAKTVKRIYNWIDTETFCPHDKAKSRSVLKLPTDKFIVLGVSQGWSEEKGLNIFIELAEKLPEIDFVLVGKSLTGRILPSNVRITGRTKNIQELVLYYSAANILLNASLQESFGLVSAEALSCGTPIVVNNVTAIPELASEGCGLVVENNDIDQYKEYLIHLKEKEIVFDPQQCRQRAIERFSLKNNIEQYLDVYKS